MALRSTSGRAPGARGRGDPVGAGGAAAVRARAGRPARLLAGRGHRRLLAGRRDRLARPQARHADQRGDRDRARHRRRPPRPHRPRARARAVLGPARRRRQLRRRDRDRVRGLPGARGLRGRAVLPGRADRRRAARVDRAAAEPARGDHLVGQRPALPAAARAPRGDPRPLVRDRHGRVPRLARPTGASCCGRCAGSTPRSTPSRSSRRSGSASWRWTRATRCPSGAPTP